MRPGATPLPEWSTPPTSTTFTYSAIFTIAPVVLSNPEVSHTYTDSVSSYPV